MTTRRALLLLVALGAGAILYAVLRGDRETRTSSSDPVSPTVEPSRAHAAAPETRSAPTSREPESVSAPGKAEFLLRVLFVDPEGRRLSAFGSDRLELRAVVGADEPGARLSLWLRAGYRGLPSRGQRRAGDAGCDEILEL